MSQSRNGWFVVTFLVGFIAGVVWAGWLMSVAALR